jgi:hypothetical protein
LGLGLGSIERGDWACIVLRLDFDENKLCYPKTQGGAPYLNQSDQSQCKPTRGRVEKIAASLRPELMRQVVVGVDITRTMLGGLWG